MNPRLPSVVLALPFVLAVSSACAVERYAIDPVHSGVTFKVKHLFSFVNGGFKDVHGTITGDPAKPEEAQVQVEIKATSIDTREEKRDQHLRSKEFFDVEQFPLISFKSKKVNLTGQDTAFVTGDLTLHGVTREVILEAKFLGKGKGPEGKIHTGWEGKTALKRSDFGLTWNKAVEGTQLVSDDIDIALEVDAVEQKEEAAPIVPPPGATAPPSSPAQTAPPPPPAPPSDAEKPVPPPPPPAPLTPPTASPTAPPPPPVPEAPSPRLPPGAPLPPLPPSPPL